MARIGAWEIRRITAAHRQDQAPGSQMQPPGRSQPEEQQGQHQTGVLPRSFPVTVTLRDHSAWTVEAFRAPERDRIEGMSAYLVICSWPVDLFPPRYVHLIEMPPKCSVEFVFPEPD